MSYAIALLYNATTGTNESFAVPMSVATEPSRAYVQCLEAALPLANAIESVNTVWRTNWVEQAQRQELATVLDEASNVVVENLLWVAEKRFGTAAANALRESEHASVGRLAHAPLEARVGAAGAAALLAEAERRAAVRVMHAVQQASGGVLPPDTTELEHAFGRAWQESGSALRQLVRAEFAYDLAEVVLRLRRPSSARFEDMTDLLRSWSTRELDITAMRSLGAEPVSLTTDVSLTILSKWLAGMGAVDGEPPCIAFPPVRKRTYRQVVQVQFGRASGHGGAPDASRPPVGQLVGLNRSEHHAKTLLALFTAASQSQDSSRDQITVDLHELVLLVTGNHRSGASKTRSVRYWRAVAEVLRYAIVELPQLYVDVYTHREYEQQGTTHRAVPLIRAPQLLAAIPHDEAVLLAHLRSVTPFSREGAAHTKASRYLMELKPTHLVFGVDSQLIRAFGVDKQAFTKVNPAVMRLRGPQLWLALDVVARRRWSDPSQTGARFGLPLLRVMEAHGFIKSSERRTGSRVSYKVALRSFVETIQKLLALGEVDGRGATFWDARNATNPLDVTDSVHGWLTSRGQRITHTLLLPVRVRYEFHDSRFTQRRSARNRARGA